MALTAAVDSLSIVLVAVAEKRTVPAALALVVSVTVDDAREELDVLTAVMLLPLAVSVASLSLVSSTVNVPAAGSARARVLWDELLEVDSLA